eukprot:764884-Hanusia_phi.AAC.5
MNTGHTMRGAGNLGAFWRIEVGIFTDGARPEGKAMRFPRATQSRHDLLPVWSGAMLNAVHPAPEGLSRVRGPPSASSGSIHVVTAVLAGTRDGVPRAGLSEGLRAVRGGGGRDRSGLSTACVLNPLPSALCPLPSPSSKSPQDQPKGICSALPTLTVCPQDNVTFTADHLTRVG